MQDLQRAGAPAVSAAWIMMYHRICEPGPDTACYHERGTAVTPARFATQIEWLAERCEMVALRELWRRVTEPGRSAGRPLCALTFDDGYRDVLERAAPICRRYAAPMCIYPVTDPVNESRPIWVDRYYDLIHRARRRSGLRARELVFSMVQDDEVPGLDDDLRWWVRGPIKEHLHELGPEQREHALRRLAGILDAEWRGSLVDALYMSRDELLVLAGVRAGASRDTANEFGGHGGSHSRLTGLSDSDLQRELERSHELLDALGVREDRSFCYPDGHHDLRVRTAVARAGFSFACTVERGLVIESTEPMTLPRCLVRDTSPEQWSHFRGF